MTLPPFLVPGTAFAVRALSHHSEERWWYSAGAACAIDGFVRASVGRRWPLYALARRWGRLTGPSTGAAWAPPIAALLAGHRLDGLDLVAQIGTPGHYRKHVAVLFDRAGERIAVLKSSHAPASRGSIRAEAAALAAMHGHLPGLSPRPLDLVDIGDQVVSLQTPIAGSRCGPWSDALRDFCHAVFLRPAPAGAERSWGAALQQREAIRERLVAAQADAPAEACARLLQRIEAEAVATLPLGWAHRDFVASNVWNAGGRIAVIDWEWADPAWAPATDLIHFHLMPSLRRGEDAGGAAQRLCAPDSPLRSYCRHAGIDADPWTLVACYLYDLVLFYCAAHDAGIAAAGGHPLIATACELARGLPAGAARRSRAGWTAAAVQTPGE